MDAYDAEVWAEIQRYRERKERFKLRRLIPENVREKAGDLVQQGKDMAADLPGAEQVQAALRAARDGLSKGVMGAALVTLREWANQPPRLRPPWKTKAHSRSGTVLYKRLQTERAREDSNL